MAEVRFQIWHLMSSGPALNDLEWDQISNWLMTMAQAAAPTGIFDGLFGSFQSHSVIFALATMGLLVVLVVLIQSLAILAFGLDRLLGRLASRSEKNGELSDGWSVGCWPRSLWTKSDD